jgi:hypothetical protein
METITTRDHRIVCKSNWDGCEGSHPTAALVRACFEAKATGAWPCTWLIQIGLTEDGEQIIVECGAPALPTDDRGSDACAAGHFHVPAEVRMEEGWDFAADEGEAMALAKAGVRPVQMDGKSFL